MRLALVNPAWSFEGSTYFGCAAPHLPLELGYAQALARRTGCETLLLDGAFDALDAHALGQRVAQFAPDYTVVTTAPTYLFWRCPPPELRVPRAFLDALGGRGGRTIAVGPHGSATPSATLRKLGVDMIVRGECEEIVAAIAAGAPLDSIGALALRDGASIGAPHAGRFTDLPALAWPQHWIERHAHHHHRFDAHDDAPGAEVEASRGCPYSCSFCAKIDFRDAYRRRDLDVLLAEIDGLIGQGVRYIYFIDEIFLPQRPLLEALARRGIAFGVQTRIDLWKPDMLDLLGAAGCVSIEAGVESLSLEGRASLNKACRMTTDDLAARLVYARRSVPFVQANLIQTPGDEPARIAQWRTDLAARGVWANDPVPLFPYPSSPDYRRLFGAPDDTAWERAHAWYLTQFTAMSDIQDHQPQALAALEACCGGAHG